MSQSAASFFDRASSHFFSPLLTRQFSSSTSSPGATSTPSTQPAFSGTGRPSSSAMRAATGASESSGLNSPSVGRPRWEVTITAAPASRAIWMAGSDARMRVSSVIRPSSSWGTLRSARMKTRWPATWPAAIRSEKRMTFMVGWSGVEKPECRALSPRRVTAASPAQAQPQGQQHRHAHRDGAEDVALPEIAGRRSQHGGPARVLQRRDELPLGHEHLGRDDRHQRRQRRDLQRLAQPARHRPGLTAEHEEAARHDGDHGQAGDRNPDPDISHGRLPRCRHAAHPATSPGRPPPRWRRRC
mmetsp:Transcript_3220/g.5765  ORF Transcript_3220/g.5765 Transcript_3220/m.5765 type:complete len:300 (+) Transcript_3220:254-1153(+)